jgi:hypothetical protein
MRISFVRPLPHERYGTLEWVPSLEFPNGKPECFAMASRSSSVCTLADTKSRVSEWDGLLATISLSSVHASRTETDQCNAEPVNAGRGCRSAPRRDAGAYWMPAFAGMTIAAHSPSFRPSGRSEARAGIQ